MKYGELISEASKKGYSVRMNINPGFMIAISEWAKDKGKEVANFIQAGDTKAAINKLVEAQKMKRAMKKVANESHDSFIYDKNGECIYLYEETSGKLFQLER